MSLPGLSAVTFWGLSPVLDLQDMSPNESHGEGAAVFKARATAGEELDRPFRVLVAGGGDFRHVLCTLARARRHAETAGRPLHIYVLEVALEPLARQLLLCNVALDANVALRERTGLVLELYGNCFLRDKSQEYLEAQVEQLLTIVTQGEHRWSSVLRCQGMKFKERDDLETVIKSWRTTQPFDMSELRGKRMREFFKERYDFRKNLVDWDYHMKLGKMADIVHPLEYRAWRELGNAFAIRDRLTEMPTQTIPNRTLASSVEGRERGRGSVLRRGFWGDIVNSPYISFGVMAVDDSLYKVANKHHRHNAQDVSEFNVIGMLHELETKEMCTTKEHAVRLGAAGICAGYDVDNNEKAPDPAVAAHTFEEIAPEPEDEPEDEEEARFRPLEAAVKEMGAQVHFLLGDTETALKKSKYTDYFDAAFVGTQYAHAVETKGHLHKSLRAGCPVAIEAARFVLELTNEHKEAYVEKVVGFAEGVGWTRDKASELRQQVHGKKAVVQQPNGEWDRGCPYVFCRTAE